MSLHNFYQSEQSFHEQNHFYGCPEFASTIASKAFGAGVDRPCKAYLQMRKNLPLLVEVERQFFNKNYPVKLYKAVSPLTGFMSSIFSALLVSGGYCLTCRYGRFISFPPTHFPHYRTPVVLLSNSNSNEPVILRFECWSRWCEYCRFILMVMKFQKPYA